MPITQDRMIVIVDSAIVLMNRLEALVKLVQDQKTAFEKNQGDSIMAVNMLEEIHRTVSRLATLPTKVVYTIAKEQAHFISNKRKNEIAREATKRWRRKRLRGEGPDIEFELLNGMTGENESKVDNEYHAIDFAELIEAVSERFQLSSTMKQDALDEIILDITDSESNSDPVTKKLWKDGVIQPKYPSGPAGFWLKGTMIGGEKSSGIKWGEEPKDMDS